MAEGNMVEGNLARLRQRTGALRESARLRLAQRRLGQEPGARRLARLGSRLGLGFVLALGRIFSGGAPFGLAFVAASGAGADGWFALLGALGGYLMSLGLEDGLRYSAGCILTFALASAFYDTRWGRSRNLLPLAAGALCGLTGAVTLPGYAGYASWAHLAGEVGVCVAGAYAFRSGFALLDKGFGASAAARQKLALGALALCVLTALEPVKILGKASAGRSLAALGALAAAYATGSGAGAVVGLTGGMAMDLSGQGAAGFYAVSFALGGIAAGMLRKESRSVSAGCFAVAWGLVTVWNWQSPAQSSVIFEMLLTALGFLALPKRWMERLGRLMDGGGQRGEDAFRLAEAQRKLHQAAEGFDAVFAALKAAFPRRWRLGEPEDLMEEAVNEVCRRCGARELCWQRDYSDTHEQLARALKEIERENRVEPGYFPQRFRERCRRFPQLVEALSRRWQEEKRRRQLDRRLEESRAVVREQYGALARTLEAAAEAMARAETVDAGRTRVLRDFLAQRELDCEGKVSFSPEGHLRVTLNGRDAQTLEGEEGAESLSAVIDVPLAALESDGKTARFAQREPLRITAGMAGRAKEGEAVSGDAGIWFKDEEGRCSILLCDGMGSGEQARRDSQVTLDILEKLLRAGVSAENALRTVDQALALRSEGDGGFTALDLMTLDLYSGQGCLYKLGAPGSYLKRGGTVVKLSGGGLPAGAELRERAVEKACFRLSPGDCLLLVTDGVLDGGDEWLRSALSAFESGSPTELARAVVQHGDGEDDRTALVVRVGCS